MEEPGEAREEAQVPRLASHPHTFNIGGQLADLDDVDLDEVFTQRVKLPEQFQDSFGREVLGRPRRGRVG